MVTSTHAGGGGGGGDRRVEGVRLTGKERAGSRISVTAGSGSEI